MIFNVLRYGLSDGDQHRFDQARSRCVCVNTLLFGLSLACLIVILYPKHGAANDTRSIESPQIVRLQNDLNTLRDTFSQLRDNVELAETQWKSHHSELLSVEDLRDAHRNLIRFSEGDLASLIARRYALSRHRVLLSSTQTARASLRFILATSLRDHLIKRMTESHKILNDLDITERQILSREQRSRLDYYRLEKFIAQLDFNLWQKNQTLIHLLASAPKYDARSHIPKPDITDTETTNVSKLVGKVSTTPIDETQISWPNAIRSLTDKRLLNPPITAPLLRRFGQPDDRGAAAMGNVFAAPSGSRVHAPFDGLVVFADHFRDQNGVIIIAHRNNWHTVLTGLAQLHTSLGRWVFQDEPLGVMPLSDNVATPLYHELRQHGTPVSPS